MSGAPDAQRGFGRASLSEVLRLVPIHCGTRSWVLDPLADRLAETFGVQVKQHYPGFDPELAYDPSRGQYNSRALLAALLNEASDNGGRVLGVTSVDLFIPVLTYVFGEAQLGGRAAIASFYRLDNAIYGLPASEDLLLERLCKEAIHEVGHTYELLHCDGDRCVMSSSTYVDGVDVKSERFCPDCRESLRRNAATAPAVSKFDQR